MMEKNDGRREGNTFNVTKLAIIIRYLKEVGDIRMSSA